MGGWGGGNPQCRKDNGCVCMLGCTPVSVLACVNRLNKGGRKEGLLSFAGRNPTPSPPCCGLVSFCKGAGGGGLPACVNVTSLSTPRSWATFNGAHLPLKLSLASRTKAKRQPWAQREPFSIAPPQTFHSCWRGERDALPLLPHTLAWFPQQAEQQRRVAGCGLV